MALPCERRILFAILGSLVAFIVSIFLAIVLIWSNVPHSNVIVGVFCGIPTLLLWVSSLFYLAYLACHSDDKEYEIV